MSRRGWVLVGLVLAVGLGFGLRRLDRTLAPPKGDQPVSPAADALNRLPFVRVTAAGLWFDRAKLSTARQLRADPEQRIAPLVKELQVIRRSHAANPDRFFTGMIIVCADPGLSFGLVRRVLRSCRQAGFDHVDFGVPLKDRPPKASEVARSWDCSRYTVSTKPPRPPGRGPGVPIEQTIRFEVMLTAEGIVLQAGGERLPIPKAGAEPNLKGLLHELKQIKMRLPNKDDLVLSVGDDVKQADLIGALGACAEAGYGALTLELKRADGELISARSSGSDAGTATPGTGLGGGPVDSGVGSPRPFRAAHVILGRPLVRGPLGREVVRRIVRRHVNEVKYCYQRELVQAPALAGRVELSFVILASGQVVGARVKSSTIKNHEVEQCLARAVNRWLFPKLRAGIVSVDYPFVLRPARRLSPRATPSH